MEQNSQNRRPFYNERNANQNQNRDNQGYGNFCGNDNYRDNEGRRDQYGGSDTYSDKYYGQKSYNRDNDNLNESGWNNWSDQDSSNNCGNKMNQDNNSDRRDYNRSNYNSNSNQNRDFDSFRNDDNWQSVNNNFGHNDFNQNKDSSNKDYGYSQRRQNLYGTDYNRSNQQYRGYGRNNFSENYGNNYYDYGNNNFTRVNRNNNQENDLGWWDRTKDEVSSWFGDDDARRRRDNDDKSQNRSQYLTSHKGKGPKDYKRSKERIREDVSDKLSDSHDVDATDIDVKVQGTEVTLSGQVNTKYEKRLAEDIAEKVSGVSNVQNNLRVNQQQNNWNTKDSNSITSQPYNSSSYGSDLTKGINTDATSDYSATNGNDSDSTDKNKSTENKVRPEKANLS